MVSWFKWCWPRLSLNLIPFGSNVFPNQSISDWLPRDLWLQHAKAISCYPVTSADGAETGWFSEIRVGYGSLHPTVLFFSHPRATRPQKPGTPSLTTGPTTATSTTWWMGQESTLLPMALKKTRQIPSVHSIARTIALNTDAKAKCLSVLMAVDNC